LLFENQFISDHTSSTLLFDHCSMFMYNNWSAQFAHAFIFTLKININVSVLFSHYLISLTQLFIKYGECVGTPARLSQQYVIMSLPIFIWERHFFCQSCLSFHLSHILSGQSLLFYTAAIEMKLHIWKDHDERKCSAVHKGHNYSMHIFLVIVLCWVFLSNFVWTTTHDLLLLLKWNFIYKKSMMREMAAHKVHNSSIIIF